MLLIVPGQNIGNSHSDEEDDILYSQLIDAKEDWQYAAYFMALGAIGGNVSVKGLDLFEEVPEKKVIEAFQDALALLSIRAEFIKVRQNVLRAFMYKISHSPNLILPLILLANFAEGTSVLDEIGSVINQNPALWQARFNAFEKQGMKMRIQDNILIIDGQPNYEFINYDGLIDDPEFSLMKILLALNSNEKTHQIKIDTSFQEKYPNFINDINSLIKQKIEIQIAL